MTYALGIDPSLVNTACLLGCGAPSKKQVEILRMYSIKLELKKFEHEIARLAALTESLLAFFELCEELIPADSPRVLCIENYAYGSAFSRQASLGEWGGQIRVNAWARGWTTITIPPTSLKKFVTDNGRAKKNEMMREINERWKYKAKDDNDADAYALMRVGLLFASHLQSKAVSQDALALFKKCSVYAPARAA